MTPPVVGSVRIEKNGIRASWSLARAAEIFAICIRESAPSCMRAPPEVEMTISGRSSSRARSAARVIFSPTTEPIDPPMKPYSMAAATTGIRSISPVTQITASLSPVFLR